MDLATNEDVGVPAAVPSTSKHGSSSNPTTSERKISLENAHEMRITRGGQIRSFVRYALKSFEVSFRVFSRHVRGPLVTLGVYGSSIRLSCPYSRKEIH